MISLEELGGFVIYAFSFVSLFILLCTFFAFTYSTVRAYFKYGKCPGGDIFFAVLFLFAILFLFSVPALIYLGIVY